MIVSPDALRKETVLLLRLIDVEMDNYKVVSEGAGKSPFRIPNVEGNFNYGELVTAKLTAINTLAILNEQGKKR